MPPISIMIKPASSLCNMHCDYCFYCDETSKRSIPSYGMMHTDTLKNIIRKTLPKANINYSIAFQGGEPTLCGIDFFKKAVDYCNQYNKNNVSIQFSLQTNGYALNEEWAKFFYDNHFLIGISIDGTRELHDNHRRLLNGNSTYDRIIENTKLLDLYHVDYNVLTVVHKDIAKNIKQIYKKYRKNNWNFLQFIACLDPLEEEKGKNSFSLLPTDYGIFLKELFELWIDDFRHGCQPFIRQFENYVGILLGYPPEACEQRGVCGIQYVFEADGSAYPCDFYAIDSLNLGNINNTNLQSIDQARLNSNFLQRSSVIPQQCKQCKWFLLCRNGCYRNRVDHINYFCKSYQYFFEHCIDDLNYVAEFIYKKRK